MKLVFTQDFLWKFDFWKSEKTKIFVIKHFFRGDAWFTRLRLHRITERQNSWGRKGPLGPSGPTSTQARALRAELPGPYPGSSEDLQGRDVTASLGSLCFFHLFFLTSRIKFFPLQQHHERINPFLKKRKKKKSKRGFTSRIGRGLYQGCAYSKI